MRNRLIAWQCLVITVVVAIMCNLAIENKKLQNKIDYLTHEKMELLNQNDAQNAEITRLRAHILGLGG